MRTPVEIHLGLRSSCASLDALRAHIPTVGLMRNTPVCHTCSVSVGVFTELIVSGLIGSTDLYHESRRCSKDTYPESYITKYTSIRRLPVIGFGMGPPGAAFEPRGNNLTGFRVFYLKAKARIWRSLFLCAIQGYLAPKKLHPPRTLP